MEIPAKYLPIVFFALFTGVFSACGNEIPPWDDPTGTRLPVKWAELPAMNAAEGIRYVTHWISSDGMSKAGDDTPGRVRNYTIAFDVDTRQPLWVAYPMHSWYDGEVGRSDNWSADPYVLVSEQPNLRQSYKPVGDNGSFSRGPMLASDCRQRSRAMNEQTFYYTNSAPQTQNAFNGGIWLRLENLEKEWGFRGIGTSDTLYVVTGSTFIGDDGRGFRVTSDNNGREIPVPTHFYKALLTTKNTGVGKPIGECSAAELKCVVFYLEHFGHATSARPTERHMMSVDDLEQATGMEFFPMISKAAESVEGGFDPAEWGMPAAK